MNVLNVRFLGILPGKIDLNQKESKYSNRNIGIWNILLSLKYQIFHPALRVL